MLSHLQVGKPYTVTVLNFEMQRKEEALVTRCTCGNVHGIDEEDKTGMNVRYYLWEEVNEFCRLDPDGTRRGIEY